MEFNKKIGYIRSSIKNNIVKSELNIEFVEYEHPNSLTIDTNFGAVDITSNIIADAWIKDIKHIKQKYNIIDRLLNDHH